LGSLGWVALCQNDFKRMRELLRESLSVRLDVGNRGGIAWCLEKLAQSAFLEGELLKAVTVFGGATALREPIGSVIDPADQPEYEQTVAQLRTALGHEVFTAAWAEGETMPLEIIIAYALSEPDAPVKGPSHAEKDKYGGLTVREREVAVLIGHGKSNREIAEAMVIGVRTVETYVTRILNKLGFDSRVQIATWALERGLAVSTKK
jgi:DNA-binding CsgD family transcriptional regulator